MTARILIGAFAGFVTSLLFALRTHALSVGETGLLNAATNAGLATTGTSVEQYVGAVINALLSILGIIFLVLIVYGGLLWMLSEGDETKVGKARGFIFHSIIGLIVVLAAYAITNFVVNALIQTTVQ